MNLPSFVFTVLSNTVVYALFALAIVLAYRSSRVLLFCVGETGVIAAYLTLNVANWVSGGAAGSALGLAAGLCAALAASAAIGAALYWVLGRNEGRSDPFVGTAVTIAFSIALLGVMTILWKGQIARLPVTDRAVAWFGAPVQETAITITLIGAVLVASLLTLVYRSGIGRELLAVSGNRTLARLRGIPVQRRLATVWIGSSVISGLAGIGSCALSAVSIEGSAVGFSGIVAAIIGGLTSPGGAIAGAFLLALGESATNLYMDARYSVAVPVFALVALLAVRPSGLSAKIEAISRT